MHQMHDGSLETRVVNARDECGALYRVAVEPRLDTLDAGGWTDRGVGIQQCDYRNNIG